MPARPAAAWPMSSDSDLFRRQLQHESRASLTVAAVFDPHPAAVHAYVLVDQRQSQPGAIAARAPSGDRAARKAFENQAAFLDGYARAVILDDDPHVGQRLALTLGLRHADFRCTTTV